MKKILFVLLLLWMFLVSLNSADAQVSIGISTPNVSIGINMPVFPELVPVPGYPVYYAPQAAANYFFYDGMYWVFQNDNWYASSWYNGPWDIVDPWYVPPYILRIPVRYYRQPPVYFRGWQRNAPPRWGQHWGHEWAQDRRGWDKWKRGSTPAPAPLPVYQRQYAGDRYPRQVEQQHSLRNQHYRYQPRNKVVRQHYQQAGRGREYLPSQRGSQEYPQKRGPMQHNTPPSSPGHQGGQAGPRPQQTSQGREQIQRSAPSYPSPQQRPPAAREQYQQPEPAFQEQRGPRPKGQEHKSQDRGMSPEYNRGHDKGQKDEDRGRGRDN